MIKVVFFDAGGTLIMPFPSVGAIYAKVAERHGVSISPQDLNLRFREAWDQKKSERMKVDKAWWKKVVNLVFKGHAFKNPEAFFEDLYSTFESKESWRVFDDVKPTLEALKQKGLRLAVASNWDARLPNLLEVLGLSSYFEEQFISFYLGFVKPDPRFFRFALSKMSVDPLEALHVGDDPAEDAEGAQSVGIRAYLIDRKNKPKNSRSLVSLEEILVRI